MATTTSASGGGGGWGGLELMAVHPTAAAAGMIALDRHDEAGIVSALDGCGLSSEEVEVLLKQVHEGSPWHVGTPVYTALPCALYTAPWRCGGYFLVVSPGGVDLQPRCPVHAATTPAVIATWKQVGGYTVRPASFLSDAEVCTQVIGCTAAPAAAHGLSDGAESVADWMMKRWSITGRIHWLACRETVPAPMANGGMGTAQVLKPTGMYAVHITVTPTTTAPSVTASTLATRALDWEPGTATPAPGTWSAQGGLTMATHNPPAPSTVAAPSSAPPPPLGKPTAPR